MPPSVAKQSPNAVRRTPTRAMSVVDRIQPIGFEADDGIKILIYGQSGSGKTTLWSTFPGPILSCICSGSKKPGELRSVDTPEMRKKIDSVTLQTVAEIAEVLHHVRESDKYRTVVLDHATGLQDLALKEVLGLDELPAQKSWGMATQQQYGQSSQQTKEVLRAFLNLDCNVVIVAQERTFGDENTSELIAPTVGASLSPAVVAWLNPICDYIVQTHKRGKTEVVKNTVANKTVETLRRVKGVEFCLRTGIDDLYQTKFRVPRGTVLPDVIVDPDYDKINRLIKGLK